MAISKEQKKSVLADLNKSFDSTKSIVFASFEGLSVTDVQELRQKCKQNGVKYVVAKKTLVNRALKDHKIDLDTKTLDGSMATVFSIEDEVAAAKVLAEFSKTHENLKIMAGILENDVIDIKTIKDLSKLPSKDQLLAQLVGQINAPVSGFVNVLTGNIRGIVNVLNNIKDNKVN